MSAHYDGLPASIPTVPPVRLVPRLLLALVAPGALAAQAAAPKACAMPAPATTADHVVRLAARPTVQGVVVPQPTSDEMRRRLDVLLREVGAEVEVPPALAFVLGPGTDFYLNDALSPRPDTLAFPMVRGRLLLALHADGRVTGVTATRVSPFPALDSAVAAAVARAAAKGHLGGIVAAGARGDSDVVALDVTTDVDPAAVEAPLARVRIPRFRATPAAIRRTVAARYPDAQRSSGAEGNAVVRFVVDEAGRADPLSVQVVSHTHRDFARAALGVVPQMRFDPAEVGGCPVRLQVQVPFEFALRR